MKNIEIVIADDHVLLRQGLTNLLSMEPQLQVVGQAASGQEAIDICRLLNPQILLLDYAMPGMTGKDTLRRLQDIGLATRVIILTGQRAISEVDACLNLGARGYLLKTTDLETLILAIKTVTAGKLFIQPILVEALDHWRMEEKSRGRSTKLEQLTAREEDILLLIAQGKGNAEIAQTLYISEKTVKNHVSSLLRKLGVKDRTQAAIYALNRANSHKLNLEY